AKKLKAKTLLITTNSREKIIQKGINEFVDVIMAPCVGPEVVAGSTRMKSGTAQKLILNMLTTTAMIKMGKTYGNIMIDLIPTNNKLKQRSKKILIELAGVTLEEAESILIQTNWNLKHALIMLIANVDLERADAELNKANGVVKKAIKNILLN
ncbi:MAG: N-acetylmuramic acid 6-phosphate etherase, partial [Bacteroidetes bacterium]|nr:N-acetylmuramic acid 6-phosphate etherase [Bacteroidota bacterium]